MSTIFIAFSTREAGDFNFLYFYSLTLFFMSKPADSVVFDGISFLASER